MFAEDFVRRILIEPYDRGADQLKVLSGYASAAMATRHLKKSDEISSDLSRPGLSVEVVYGMALKDGVPVSQHRSFVDMASEKYKGRFKCNYLVESPPVHAKAFIWCKDGEPIEAYLGSANYTQVAFLGRQVEVMTCCDAGQANELFEVSKTRSLECDHDDVEDSVRLYKHDDKSVDAIESVNLSFLVRNTGETPTTSGINWGQRGNRNRNEADLRVRAEIARSGFFPPRAVQFTMNTDDGFSMLCVVAQDNNKGIHTTESNAILGEYIRRRLGLYAGEYVNRSHFEDYGRADLTIHKIDDETFYMDFSVSD